MSLGGRLEDFEPSGSERSPNVSCDEKAVILVVAWSACGGKYF